ncbi:hypothetical protein JYU34_022466, partial [Plutella xylostella]
RESPHRAVVCRTRVWSTQHGSRCCARARHEPAARAPPAPCLRMARADWPPRRRQALAFLLLIAFPSTFASWSSSQQPELDAELVRDAPLYPLLQGRESLDADPASYDDPALNGPSLQNNEALPKSNYELDDSENKPKSLFEELTESEATLEDIKSIIEESKELAEDGKVETDDETNVQNDVDVSEELDRRKRSSEQDWNKTSGTSRVRTGDTILNIRGAVRDRIGDAPRPAPPPGAPPAPASRLDTVVIRPAAASLRPPLDRVHKDPKTTQSPREGSALLVEAHARASIACDLRNVTRLQWYKDGELIPLPWGSHSGEGSWRESAGGAGGAGGEVVVVARATRGDAAVYRCTGVDAKGSVVAGAPTELMIYEPVRAVYLAVDGRRLDAGNTWVPARDAAALPVTCHAEGGVPPPSLSWRLAATDEALDTRPYLNTQPTNYSIDGVSTSLVVVRAARELHNASLQCTATQRGPRGDQESSAKMEIRVTYPPSFVISRWPGFGVALRAGGAAALRCDVDANPPARAWWIRDTTDPTSAPPPSPASSPAATLRFAPLSAEHAGWYRCRAVWMHQHYSSIGYYLNVHPPDESSEATPPAPPAPPAVPDDAPDHQRVEVQVGGNVQLHCPKGSVGCWWRRSDNSTAPGWTPAGSHHAHGVLGIKEALYQEGGEYRCIGAKAPDLARLRELKRVTLRVTGAATATAVSAAPAAGGWRLECLVCGRGARGAWLRRGGEGSTPAELRPAPHQHCWSAVLTVPEPDEVWCVASGPAGGSVAVFPARAPAPARHLVRQPTDSAVSLAHTATRTVLLALTLLLTYLTYSVVIKLMR